MRLNIAIIIAAILALTAFTSIAMAGDPLEKENDKEFLNKDPDGDGLKNLDEFKFGTNPFNSDSDNDGLPDGWEVEYSPLKNPAPNALMNPADSSDAHLDFDYDPTSNGTGYNIGEREATFIAVEKLLGGQPVTWPSNPEIIFTQPVSNEEGPHYDNYEEYYRPYTDVAGGNVIRFMHTNPIKPDTDGDAILDPDDFEPLGWANDGTSPGGSEGPETNIEVKNEDNDNSADLVKDEITVEDSFEIFIEEMATVPQQPTADEKNNPLLDIDNDGI